MSALYCRFTSNFRFNQGQFTLPVRSILFTGIFLSLLVPNMSFSQVSPANIGFEAGNFNGWVGATGQCCPVYTPQSGIDTARHIITSGNFTDPYSNGMVNVVAPGSLFSARLGNNSGSAESENLEYAFTVPSDSLLLVIRFAVILENGNHPPIKQSRFKYEITGNGGNLTGCLTEQVTAGDSTINFIINGAYEMLDWQTRVVNLTGLQGITINIHFETGDCEPGGHFGYAYVDGELKPAELSGTFCNPDGGITLFAPSGLHGTWFDGSTADSINIISPLAGSNYTLDLEHENGCTVTLSKIVNGMLPESDFTVTPGCNYETFFQNNSICHTGSTYSWEFGDGQTGSTINPIYNYNAPGTYEITLTVQQPDNCRSTHSETILVNENAESGFEVEGNCIYHPVKFTNTASAGNQFTYAWYIDNQLAYTTASPEHIFYQSGLHHILLILTDANGCTDSSTAELLIEQPGDCQGEENVTWFPNAFTPNADGKNDYFEAITDDTNSQITITVRNRFGEIIYTGNKWDGNKMGNVCPEGIYSYSVAYSNQSQGQKLTGTVLLVR